ncbi:MAG: undecaprenyldiphospho-muramoylpentapeptide beta-N-acetylglucosaminyltransferase [Bacteroidota bacterium]
MSQTSPRILLAGGGTGGHVFPALAIADEIKKLAPASEFLFVGTKGKIEARVVPQRGYRLRTIWISGVHRRLAVSNLWFPAKLAVALAESFFLIKQFRPDVVVGTGGYVSGPVLFAASLLGMPTVIHESNSYPGITTRLAVPRATKVLVAFDETRRWLKRTDNVELVGTPTRNELGNSTRESGLKFFGLNPEKKTVLVFGGSLGAASINNAVLALADELLQKSTQLIWQTGQSDFKRVQFMLGGKKVGWVGPFIDRMEDAYAAADVAVSRAGAITVAELTRVGVPAIVVPYPYAAADHQTLNARALVDAGAAVMIRDPELQTDLRTELLDLLEDEHRRATMAQASKRLGKPEAGRAIAEKILELVV